MMIYEESAKMLTDISDEQAGRITKGLCAFFLTGETIELENSLEQAILNDLIGREKRHQTKYNEICKKNSENVRKRYQD